MSTRPILARAGIIVLSLAAAQGRAQTPFCLPDADGDGHPLFGNPEVMLNPFAPLMGLNVVPISGAIGDLDGDGDVDAVATYAASTPTASSPTQVSVLLNKGDGVFVADAVYAPGDFPSSAAIGDLNADGLGDLAITNVFAGTVSVLINAGSVGSPPSFPNRVTYAVGTKPRSVVMADLDGDLDLDLAVANGQANTVSILKNNGNGTFAAATSYPVANIPDASVLLVAFGGPYLAAGDLDGDSDLDLALPNTSGVSILKNNGNGTFAAQATFPAGGSVWAVAIGDVDGDQDADLVAARFASDMISVLKNNGNATFAAPTAFSVVPGEQSGIYEPATVTVGDLDGDGDLDLASGLSYSQDWLSIWKNQGDGTFAELKMLPADERPRVVAMADLNGDSHLDLAVFAIGCSAEKLCSLLNDGTGTLITDQTAFDPFDPPTPNPWNEVRQIEFVDLDTDGDLDIVVASPGDPTPNIAVEINLGDGAFSAAVHYQVMGFYPGSLTLADLDRDGDQDVVLGGPETVAAASPGFLGSMLNNGDGSFADAVVFPSGGSSTRFVALADVDSDLDLDIVTSNLGSNDVSFLENDGSANFAGPVVIALPIGTPGPVVAGDLDHDADVDLIIAKLGAPEVLVMQGDGAGGFTAGTIYGVLPKTALLKLADLDDDCDLDLVVSSGNTTTQPVTFSILTNDGSGVFESPVQYWLSGTRGAQAIATGDIDLDGLHDLVVSTRGAASVFLGEGGGDFHGVSYGSGLGILGVALGDLDGDGDIDLGTANASASSQTFSLLWSRGCQEQVPGSPSDLDSDGDVDLEDWAALAACLAGPRLCQTGATCNPPGIADADLDGDGDVDLRDIAGFANAFSP